MESVAKATGLTIGVMATVASLLIIVPACTLSMVGVAGTGAITLNPASVGVPLRADIITTARAATTTPGDMAKAGTIDIILAVRDPIVTPE